MPFRLLVSSDDAEEAGRVIAEAIAGGAEAAEEAERAGEVTGDTPPEDADSGTPGLF